MTSVPNASVPLIPQAFLPPVLAYQLSITTYILIGAGSILIWDILHNLHGDYRLLFQYKIGWPTIAYFVSRIAAFGYIIMGIIFQTAPIGHCYVWQKVHCTCYTFVISASALLFLLRVQAIFEGKRYITVFFFAMWIAVLGGSITLPLAVTGSNIGSTKFCINSKVAAYSGAATIIPVVNDTFVFLAISWRLAANAYSTNRRDEFKTLLFGTSLPIFSKALLQDGQKYYLATVIVNIATVAILYAGSTVPVVYRTMFSAPNVLIINVMACRVYRDTKFGLFSDGTSAGGERTVKMGASLPVFEQPPYSSSGVEKSKTGERYDDMLYGDPRQESKDTVV